MKTGKQSKKGKSNNQGFSLLELLIAVIVMAIIVVPFLNSFIQAARANGRAAKTHRATIAAQNLMEGFKADTLESIAWQMTYPEKEFHVIDKGLFTGNVKNSVYEMCEDVSSGSPVYMKSIMIDDVKAMYPGKNEKELLTEFVTYETVTGGTARRGSIFSFDGGENYSFIDQKDGKYYFAVEGIQIQGSTFDAKIVMDGTKFRAGGSLPAEQQYNSAETVQIMGMDTASDAIIVQSYKMDEEAIGYFHNLNWPETVTEKDIKREITVTVKVTGGSKPIHNVKVKYEYTYLKDGTKWSPAEPTAFDNSETGRALRAIYLYYLPLYSSQGGVTGITDTIVIDNASAGGSLPLDIYVVKQEHGQQAKLQTNENKYRMELHIKDKPVPSVVGAIHKSFRTNLDWNLANVHRPEGSAEIPMLHLQAKYSVNGVTMNTQADKEDKLHLQSNAHKMTADKAEDRIFTINVRVYEEGAAANNFPEEDKLAELAGERNN